MNQTSAINDLSNVLKSLSSEDYVWLLHVVNKDEIEFNSESKIKDFDSELVENDIKSLNSIINIKEVKDIVISKYTNYRERDINYIIKSIDQYKSSIHHRGIDLTKYKNNIRLLNFVLYKLTDDYIDYHNIEEIKNDYLKLIYIVFIVNKSMNIYRKLERIENEFSRIISENSLHFKNCDNTDFYIWVSNYINNDKKISRLLNFREHSPTQDNDFKNTILITFDQIYSTDKNAYQVIKEKISNAWYQKNYRKNNKGKNHRYFFTDKAKPCLEIIASKENTTEEKMLEKLINQHYASHYVNLVTGEDLYSLN